MHVYLHKILNKIMLNRRILRIKAFKVLYSSVLAENMSLAQAEAQLDASCEAARDLYIYMLGIVSPLTQIARERIDKLRKVSHLQWPVVHLLVDVQVHVAIPWTPYRICPDTLKVRW